MVPAGKKVRRLLEKAFELSPELEQTCLSSIGTGPGPSEAELDITRRGLAALWGVEDIGEVKCGDFSTEIRAGLLEGWRAAAGDPDWAVTTWLRSTGVPAGLRRHPEDCGIFPRTDVPAGAPEMLHTDMDEFKPYTSVETDEDAWQEVLRLTGRRWLKKLATHREVVEFLGEEPVLSKFGLVVKVRFDRIKKRLILDSKASGVSSEASKLERVLLPRMLDVAMDVLALLATGAEVELFVLDFADAFWLLPLAPSERKWFVS